MSFEFWNGRWQSNQTAFHEGKPNDFLVAHLDAVRTLVGKEKLRVLVPLAGKSVDVQWLSEQGHEVVGVEFVRKAIDELFGDAPVREHKLGPHDAFSVGLLTMLCDDFFRLQRDVVGTFDLIFDRAALIAIAPDTRQQYVELCHSLLGAAGQTLLVSIAYDQQKTDGPPWSVDSAAVHLLFAGRPVDTLDSRAITPPGRLAEAGVTDMQETAYLIGK
jgi:thiopurine S-methyltransferase